MSEYFRIVRGLELDEGPRILTGTGAPGTTSDTIDAPVGSFYLDNTGDSYTKHTAGSGTGRWAETGSGSTSQLTNENASSPNPPVADGINSIALGSGAHTDTEAPNSLAIGDQSLSRYPGSVVVANGRFGSAGDAQAGLYLLRTVTVNNVFTEAFFDGTNGTSRMVLPDDSTWTFTATITGHRQDAGDGHAGYKVEGVVYRGSGVASVAILGAPVMNVIAESNSAWDVKVAADTTNGSLRVTVKGEPGKIIRWVARVETVEVTN